MHQLSFAFRTLKRAKGYAFVTVLILAIAIGANTAMFTILYSVLLRALPYPEPSRLLEIGRLAGKGVESVTYPVYEQWRDRRRAFASLGVYLQNTGVTRVTLRLGEEPEGAKAAFVSASFFEVMGVSPQLGRVFTKAEEESREPVAILSEAFWRTRFGEQEAIDTLVLPMNGLSYRVIGVMPPSFAWPSRDMVAWVPITCSREWARRAGPVPLFRVVGRIAPGVSRTTAQEELKATYTGEQGTAGAVPLRPPLSGDHERALYLLTAAVGLVLLIACANIASLTLARGSRRASEIAMRVALGASRGRITAELFVESLLLAAGGATGGVLLALTAIDVVVKLRPANMERIDTSGVSGALLIYSVIATLVSALLFGLLPAWQLSGRNPIDALRGLTRGSSSAAPSIRLRRWIVAGEVALTAMLVAGSGLMFRSLAAAQKVDLGFDVRGMLTFRVLFPESTPRERRVQYFRDLTTRIAAVPQVRAVGGVMDLFELQAPNTLGLREVEGRPTEPRDAWTPLTWTTVSGNYFEAMGAHLARGRWFDERDGPGAPRVAIVDESTARRYWPGEDPIGRRFKGQDARGQGDEWVTVIGVVKNMRRQGVDREPTAHVYEWYRQSANVPRDVVVRTMAPIGAEIRAVARALDPSVILSGVKTVESEIDDQLSTRRFQTTLLSIFASMAFVLAAVGVYGVVAYSVSARTREFGIRAALGEPQRTLRIRVLREALFTALAGIVPGVCGVVLVSRLARSLVFGVSAVDPLSLGGACVLLAATTMAAASAPAIRASRVDPAVALREE